MLNTLRRVSFPSGLQTSGPVIKASMLKHVKTHTQLIENGEQVAAELLAQAQEEARKLKETTQAEVAQSLKKDLESIRLGTQLKEKALYERSASLCVNVCTAVFQQVIHELPASEKIRSLVEVLLNTAHHGRVLQLQCHPDQIDTVNREVANSMAKQLNMRQWSVQGSDELQLFEIQISTSNGAEIQVSLDNLLAIYKDEIEALGQELSPLIQLDEEQNENID